MRLRKRREVIADSAESAIRNPHPEMTLSFDQAYVAGARAFLGIFGGELDPLAFAQQLKHGAADRAAVEEVFDPALVADEPEPLVDQEPCDCPGWHNPKPSVPNPQGYPKGAQPGAYEKLTPSGRDTGRAFIQPGRAGNS